jgi:small-conductance mechanosensitive channel
MFGFFGKKKDKEQAREEVVSVDDIQVADVKVLAEKQAQAKRDAEQDKVIKQMEARIAKLTNTIKEMKEVDKTISESDANQTVRLKELTRNYLDVKNKLDSFDVRTKVTVKNVNTIKTKLSRLDLTKVDGNVSKAIEDSLALIDTIIERFK